MENKKRFYRPGEISRMFGVSTKTISNWVKKGYVSGHYTPGGHLRVDINSVTEYVYRDESLRRGE